jgi:hypothetical protein
MDLQKKGPDDHATGAVKKPYATPQLQVYGELREITQSAGMTGIPDGAPGSNNRTH